MYNGYKNYNHWNVSLWINNDESLYRMAKHCIRIAPTRYLAAKYMLQDLRGLCRTDKPTTPDGVPYSVAAIRAAMVGM